MKKNAFILLLLLLLSILSVSASDPMIVAIPVDFTLERGIFPGFSRDPIDDIFDPVGTLDSITFRYDRINQIITSDPFYLNIQAFVTEGLRVSVAGTPFNKTFSIVDGSYVKNADYINTAIEYENIGRTSEVFPGSDGSGKQYPILEEMENSGWWGPEAMEFDEPRPYSFEFILTVDPDDLTDIDVGSADGIYTTLSVTVETLQ